jgi:hypothetical protein
MGEINNNSAIADKPATQLKLDRHQPKVDLAPLSATAKLGTLEEECVSKKYKRDSGALTPKINYSQFPTID